jgi:hypothetical protein
MMQLYMPGLAASFLWIPLFYSFSSQTKLAAVFGETGADCKMACCFYTGIYTLNVVPVPS